MPLDLQVESHYANVNGIRMHYVKAGSGKRPLLLLHGFPEFWYSWRYQLAGLSDEFTVIAPDLRGYNLTEKPTWGYDLDVLVSDVVSLIHTLGYERVSLVGHDWGGIIAWSLATVFPQRVTRLAILNAPHPQRWLDEINKNWNQRLRSWYLLFFQLPWLPEQFMRLGNYASIAQLLEQAVVSKGNATADDLQRYRDALSRPGALTAAINYYRGLRHDPLGMFARSGFDIRVPTMVLWGEDDVALAREINDGLEQFVPDLRIHYLPGCAHWPQQELPEQVNSYIRAFMTPD